MFTNKKREGISTFVCDVSLYVAKTPKASIKYHKPPLPIIPFGIVAYGFVGQPFSKQLYIKNRQSMTACSLLRLCYDSVVNCPQGLKQRHSKLPTLKIILQPDAL